MTNREEMAEMLEKIALLLELKGENPFEVRAYRQGAEIVLSMEEDVVELARNDGLKGVKGIGEALRDKLGEMAKTGGLEFYEKLKAGFPETVFELFEVQGLGPKKIKAMYDALGVDSLEKLKADCEEGKVAELPGFGKKTQDKILEGIAANEKFALNSLYSDGVMPKVALLISAVRMANSRPSRTPRFFHSSVSSSRTAMPRRRFSIHSSE